MNEVTKIHLGRQAYTISVEAHGELKSYLDAIKHRVHEDEVLDEVELRMAELLTERGVTGEKVILAADVEYLKEQLGDPKDFGDDDQALGPEQSATGAKRLFRDTSDAMLAGVAAGLAKYFGVDVLLVRLLFIMAVFGSGIGIVIYIVLWLLVPEAKTPSDRLAMEGKQVTIESLKEAVERADVKGAARRANASLGGPLRTLVRFVARVIGVGLITFGLAMMLFLAGSAAYALLRGGSIMQPDIFPLGLKEHLVVYLGAGAAAIISLFIVLFGMAMFWRKWPIRGWITGTLIGLLLIGIAGGSALAADVAPQVRDRYNANIHTTTRTVSAFSNLDLRQLGDGQDVDFETGSTYSVTFRYFGHPDLSAIKTSVSDGTLTISSRSFDWHRHCDGLCIPDTYNLSITVKSPNPQTTLYPGAPDLPAEPPKPPKPAMHKS